MNPIVDTIVAILFVMLMIYIHRGYHLSKMREREEEEAREKEQENTKE
ncbi:MAG: hypothetical protein U9R50_06390 [Campylobacterota bacterium]|nr:hypothetical protein [Campylobacterota bacterium]